MSDLIPESKPETESSPVTFVGRRPSSGSDGVPPLPWQAIATAPTDGTEIVGWVPRQGHVLMIWKDECWQSSQRTKADRNGLFQHAMQPLVNQPIQWRPKQNRCTEWIW